MYYSSFCERDAGCSVLISVYQITNNVTLGSYTYSLGSFPILKMEMTIEPTLKGLLGGVKEVKLIEPELTHPQCSALVSSNSHAILKLFVSESAC